MRHQSNTPNDVQRRMNRAPVGILMARIWRSLLTSLLALAPAFAAVPEPGDEVHNLPAPAPKKVQDPKYAEWLSAFNAAAPANWIITELWQVGTIKDGLVYRITLHADGATETQYLFYQVFPNATGKYDAFLYGPEEPMPGSPEPPTTVILIISAAVAATISCRGIRNRHTAEVGR